jgi:hypothetical protein
VTPRPALLLLAVLAASACSQFSFGPMGGPPMEDITVLDGRFKGQANFARGDGNCERGFDIALEIERGRVKGEMRVPYRATMSPRGQLISETPTNAPPTVFQTYVDIDGQMSAIVRAQSGVYYMQGRFQPDRYNGVLVPENTLRARDDAKGSFQFGTYTSCSWTVVLSRSGS